MMRPKFMLVAETPMTPIDAGWSSWSILWIGAGEAAGDRRAERATRAAHRQHIAHLHGIELECLQHERRYGMAGRTDAREFEQAREERPEQFVRRLSSVALRDQGQLAVGECAPEEVQKVRGVSQSGGGVDRGPILPQVVVRQSGIEPAQAGADDHAEFTGVVKADAQFDVGRSRCGSRDGVVAEGKAREERAQLRVVQGFPSRGGGLAEDCHRLGIRCRYDRV